MPTFFRIRGTVNREPFSNEKFAKVSVLVTDGNRKAYFDVKAFSATMINGIRDLRVGDEVSIDGELMSEPVMTAPKNQGGEPIKDSRGKDIWAIGLKATGFTPAKTGAATAKPLAPAEPKMSKSMPPRTRNFDNGGESF